MNKEKVLYWILGFSILLYVVVDIYSPKEIDWTITFSENDKSPFGTYILYRELPQFFQKVERGNRTINQLLSDSSVFFGLSMQFQLSKEDVEAIRDEVEKGATVLLSGESFSKTFLDEFSIEVVQYLVVSNKISEDSLAVSFNENILFYPKNIVSSYFKAPYDWKVLATVAQQPALIRKKIGKGELILSSTPLVFTNYGLLYKNNYAFSSHILNQLPPENVDFSLFYHLGRREHQSPFRFLISQNSLKIALYLSLFLIIALLIFNSQRRHKSIAVYSRPENSTLHFIRTVGGLYKREGNNKSAALKLIYQILHVLEKKYFIHQALMERNWRKIALKTGHSQEEVNRLMKKIIAIRKAETISEKELKEFYKDIKKLNLI